MKFLLLFIVLTIPVLYAHADTVWYNKGVDVETFTNFNAVESIESVPTISPNTSTPSQQEQPSFDESEGFSCVQGVRHLGADVPKGNAIDLEVYGPPQQGGVVKLKYGEGVQDHHLAYIMAVLPKGVWVGEYNFGGEGQYNERFIAYDDPSVLGFWNPTYSN